VFVHISAVERAGLSTLNEGQIVQYEIVSNRGKESAESLKVGRSTSNRGTRRARAVGRSGAEVQNNHSTTAALAAFFLARSHWPPLDQLLNREIGAPEVRAASSVAPCANPTIVLSPIEKRDSCDGIDRVQL
jgi:hypothetical protein